MMSAARGTAILSWDSRYLSTGHTPLYQVDKRSPTSAMSLPSAGQGGLADILPLALSSPSVIALKLLVGSW